MDYLISIDPGRKNMGVSYFSNESYLGSELLSLSYSEFKDWVVKKAASIPSRNITIVVENQLPTSKFYSIPYFLEGFCSAMRWKFAKRKLHFGKGLDYKSRKKASVDAFLNEQPIPNYHKLDDIADSYNLGKQYIQFSA